MPQFRYDLCAVVNPLQRRLPKTAELMPQWVAQRFSFCCYDVFRKDKCYNARQLLTDCCIT